MNSKVRTQLSTDTSKWCHEWRKTSLSTSETRSPNVSAAASAASRTTFIRALRLGVKSSKRRRTSSKSWKSSATLKQLYKRYWPSSSRPSWKLKAGTEASTWQKKTATTTLMSWANKTLKRWSWKIRRWNLSLSRTQRLKVRSKISRLSMMVNNRRLSDKMSFLKVNNKSPSLYQLMSLVMSTSHQSDMTVMRSLTLPP